MSAVTSGAAHIVVRGARQHNLKNIDVDIPRYALTVLTGLSGSGKSSLAFDTIYAEGQRRYVESLSAYARQFLEQTGKPDVDAIEGLSPAISIEQKTTSRNPRSTVGTVTEIHDYLRLLFARIGQPFCPNGHGPVAAQTVQQIVDQIAALPEGSKLSLLAPIVRGRKGEYKKELQQLRKDGFSRALVDGEVHELDDDITMDKNKKHDIDAFVDRVVVKPGIAKRLSDSVETALRRGGGVMRVLDADGNLQVFSENSACAVCGFSFPLLEPRLFSFNNPAGACPECSGLGDRTYFDAALVVPDDKKTLAEGAIAPWGKDGYYFHTLSELARHFKVKTTTPWKKLSEKFRQIVLNGSGEEEISFKFESEANKWHFKKPFEGVLVSLERRFKESDSENYRQDLEQYLSRKPCPACHGARLKPEALYVRVAERNVAELSALTFSEALSWFANLKLSTRDASIGQKLLKEIRDRLGFLVAVGLDYLSLDRTSGTLSGGEAQRIRLATQIGSALVGVLYVLDEPSIGLHQRDNQKLLGMLKQLRDLGNTVLVVEHDEETILEADHVIDMGPGAGRLGGEVVVAGTPKEIMKNMKSLTGAYLAGRKRIEAPSTPRKGKGKKIGVVGARGHNLKNVSVEIPLGTFTAITGVSGSGKSTLILDTLYPAVAHSLGLVAPRGEPCDKITGLENIESVIDIDQSPIGRTPRSNPATYTGLFGMIRDLYAELPEAKTRGYGPGRFSFNVKGGRCEACQGDGLIRIDMQFLADLYVTCETCNGRRYNRETLEVQLKGKSIADVLDMTVAEAREFLQNFPPLKRKLDVLAEVGLGYVHLGQSATTLSGGEAQRIKIARELAKRSTENTLYILDEPTTGLHFADVQMLLDVVARLVDAGSTVVVIEHNLDVIKCADWIIDLGPEGGSRGGEIIAQGTPEQVAAVKRSYTGQFLQKAQRAA